jgi:hypothetical protein
MNLGRRLAKAALTLIQAEDRVATTTAKLKTQNATTTRTTFEEHELEKAQAAFHKAQKRIKRERSHKQLRELGLM